MQDKQLSPIEIRKIKTYYAKKWLDPVARISDIFNVRRADGSLTKMNVPEPQTQMIRDGILKKSRELVGTGVSYVSVTNKGRQLGFSVILAAEAILIAEDFPGTNIYYVATASDQASDWMAKLNQLAEDANHWPAELGGGPILNVVSLHKVFEKNINNTFIIGLSAHPPSIRGKTGIHVIFDEAAWAIRFTGQARETWKALKYIIRQGGSARIQSTPRTSDIEEMFWKMYSKGEEGNLAIHTYYCPVITNWKDLDLEEPLWIDLDNTRRKLRGLRHISEKDTNRLIKKYTPNPAFSITPTKHIKQNAIIPYWWVSIEDLETDRAEDLEQFKQENLGIPLDETYKLLKTEWIYGNLNEGAELEDRGISPNRFFILIDLAQVNDITAITVLEELPQQVGSPIYIERRIEESQESYPKQRDLIFDLYMKFRPIHISIDFTGHGRPVCEMVEEKLRDNGFNPNIVKRVTFTMASKEAMAMGFRNIVMPDAITGKSRYKWLYRARKHERAIRHCTRVEKEILPQGGVRYSGKMHGRDDFFWSKSQIALIETPTGVPRARVGRFRRYKSDDTTNIKSYGNKFIEELNQQRHTTPEAKIDRVEQETVNKSMMDRVRNIKNLAFALKCLTHGIITCKSKHKLVHPIHCAGPHNCSNPECNGFKYVDEICQRYSVTKKDLWKMQRVYPKGDEK